MYFPKLCKVYFSFPSNFSFIPMSLLIIQRLAAVDFSNFPEYFSLFTFLFFVFYAVALGTHYNIAIIFFLQHIQILCDNLDSDNRTKPKFSRDLQPQHFTFFYTLCLLLTTKEP